jgi:hypothetical protein
MYHYIHEKGNIKLFAVFTAVNNQIGGNHCFGGTYCVSLLTMEAGYSFETVVTVYQTTWCRNSGDHTMNCKFTLVEERRYSAFWHLVGENMAKCGALRKVTHQLDWTPKNKYF